MLASPKSLGDWRRARSHNLVRSKMSEQALVDCARVW